MIDPHVWEQIRWWHGLSSIDAENLTVRDACFHLADFLLLGTRGDVTAPVARDDNTGSLFIRCHFRLATCSPHVLLSHQINIILLIKYNLWGYSVCLMRLTSLQFEICVRVNQILNFCLWMSITLGVILEFSLIAARNWVVSIFDLFVSFRIFFQYVLRSWRLFRFIRLSYSRGGQMWVFFAKNVTMFIRRLFHMNPMSPLVMKLCFMLVPLIFQNVLRKIDFLSPNKKFKIVLLAA